MLIAFSRGLRYLRSRPTALSAIVTLLGRLLRNTLDGSIYESVATVHRAHAPLLHCNLVIAWAGGGADSNVQRLIARALHELVSLPAPQVEGLLEHIFRPLATGTVPG